MKNQKPPQRQPPKNNKNNDYRIAISLYGHQILERHELKKYHKIVQEKDKSYTLIFDYSPKKGASKPSRKVINQNNRRLAVCFPAPFNRPTNQPFLLKQKGSEILANDDFKHLHKECSDPDKIYHIKGTYEQSYPSSNKQALKGIWKRHQNDPKTAVKATYDFINELLNMEKEIQNRHHQFVQESLSGVPKDALLKAEIIKVVANTFHPQKAAA